jgi:regulator of cell morphogenesis and NO signaling
MAEKNKRNSERQIIIDARQIPGTQKKEYFFATFDELKENEELIIVNSHDAAPLKKLFNRERPGLFTWTNREEGPERWEISIRKIQSEDLTISDIISINPEAIYTLSEYGIHFYTSLNIKVKNLTLNRREDYQEILYKLLNHKTGIFKVIRPAGWSVPLIIQYIIENHHHFLHTKLPELQELIELLTHHFGEDLTHLQALNSRFRQFMDEIIDHLKDEEEKIFPQVVAFSKKEKIDDQDRIEIDEKLNWIVEDHYLAGDNLRAIRKICNNFQWLQVDIPGIKLLYRELMELEKDFLLHILFENFFLIQAVHRITPH